MTSSIAPNPIRLPLLTPTIALCGGITISKIIWTTSYTPLIIWISLFCAFLGIAIPLSTLLRSSSINALLYRNRLASLWIPLLFFAIGLLVYRVSAPAKMDFENEVYPPIAIGVVENSQQNANSGIALIKIIKLSHLPPSQSSLTTQNLDVHLFSDVIQFSAGDIIAFPQAFTRSTTDSSQWCQHVQASSIKLIGRSSSLKYKFHAWRNALIIKLEKSQLSSDARNFLIALALGYRHNLHPDTTQEFRTGGMSHLLALSGLHISIVATFISFFLFPFILIGYRKLHHILLIILLWSFTLLTGMEPPAIRASIMITMLLLSHIIEKKNSSLNSLLLAIIIILTFNPVAIADIGFQLSVIATIAIIIFYQHCNPFINSRHTVIKHLYSSFGIAIIAFLSTAALSAYYFHLIHPASIFANIIAGLFLPFYLAASFLYILFISIGLEWNLLAAIIHAGWKFLHEIAFWNASLPANSIPIWLSTWHIIFLLIFLTLIGGGIIYRKKIPTLIGTSAIIVIIFLIFIWPTTPNDSVILHASNSQATIQITHKGIKSTYFLPSSQSSIYRIGSQKILWLNGSASLPPGRYKAAIIGHRFKSKHLPLPHNIEVDTFYISPHPYPDYFDTHISILRQFNKFYHEIETRHPLHLL